MNKTEIMNELDANIPDSAVKTRSQGGINLSYLEAWYVIDRLNQVLGQGNWGYAAITITKVFEGEIEQHSGKVFAASYTAFVRLVANIDGTRVTFTDVGYGDGTDKRNPGKAHELAVKEAVSDGLKRAAKNLGRSMGLALYDKTQEYVGETVEKTTAPAKLGISSTSADPKKTEATKTLVEKYFKVLKAQKKVTAESFKKDYLRGIKFSALTNEQASTVIEAVKSTFPEINL